MPGTSTNKQVSKPSVVKKGKGKRREGGGGSLGASSLLHDYPNGCLGAAIRGKGSWGGVGMSGSRLWGSKGEG